MRLWGDNIKRHH